MIGVIILQGADQGDEGCALGWGAGVGSLAFLIKVFLLGLRIVLPVTGVVGVRVLANVDL